jgi:quercetin dioxygenase-like cupin family protein
MLVTKNNAIILESSYDLTRRVLSYNQRVMLVEIYIKKGVSVPKHKHESEQLTYIVYGSLQLNTDDKNIILNEGDSIIISGNSYHSAVALKNSFVIDYYMPPREDFLEKIYALTNTN